MKELLRTNDPVLLSWLIAVLKGERIDNVIFDVHTSILEGSIGALPRRVMVLDEDFSRARSFMMFTGIDSRDAILAPEEK